MKRLEYDRYGGPEVIQYRDFQVPALKPGELLVQVAAASLNPLDWKIRNGELKWWTGWRFPRGLGADFAGSIAATGPDVTGFKIGDPVLGSTTMRRAGAFAPMLITTKDRMIAKPDQLSMLEAACVPTAWVTAWLAVVQGADIHAGQQVFINGAQGAVGQAATMIARDRGADVTGRIASSSLASADALGLRTALDYGLPIPETFDHRFDLVFDAHGSLGLAQGKRLLKRGGKVIDIAPTPTKFVRALCSRSRQVLLADPRAESIQAVLDLIIAGRWSLPISEIISLHELPAVLASMEQGRRRHGRVVVAM